MKTISPMLLLNYYQDMSEKDQKRFREYLAAYERGVELAKARRKNKKTKNK